MKDPEFSPYSWHSIWCLPEVLSGEFARKDSWHKEKSGLEVEDCVQVPAGPWWTLQNHQWSSEQGRSYTLARQIRTNRKHRQLQTGQWMSAEHSGIEPVSCQCSLAQGTIHTNHYLVDVSKNPEGTTCTEDLVSPLSLYHSYRDHITFKTQISSWRGVDWRKRNMKD